MVSRETGHVVKVCALSLPFKFLPSLHLTESTNEHTVEAPFSEHPLEAGKVWATGAGRLRK